MCKVAICIPSYKNIEALKRLLDSVFMQTFQDYVVVVTDDSGTDEVKNFIETNYKRITFYKKNTCRLGATENCNEAMRCADQFKPEYIKVMHHDDFFTYADSLEKFVQLFEQNKDAKIVFSGTCQVSRNGSYTRYTTEEQAIALKKDSFCLFTGNVIGAPSAVMVKNEHIYMDPALTWLVDTEWYMRILKECKNFVYTTEPLISIGVGDGQLTNSCIADPGLQIKEHCYVFEKFSELQKKEYKKFLRNMVTSNRKQIGKNWIKRILAMKNR